MKTLFDPDIYTETLSRLGKLEPTTTPLWGKMSVGQMLHHCQKPFEITMQKKDYGLKPNLLAKWFFKKSMYNDKLWMKGLPTAKPLKITEPKVFAPEKEYLEELIKEFHGQREKTDWPDHPGFGKFTPEQIGKMQFKHLDHHLRQFGV